MTSTISVYEHLFPLLKYPYKYFDKVIIRGYDCTLSFSISDYGFTFQEKELLDKLSVVTCKVEDSSICYEVDNYIKLLNLDFVDLRCYMN